MSGEKIDPNRWKDWLKETKPALYLLWNAGWKEGYTVNGIPAWFNGYDRLQR